MHTSIKLYSKYQKNGKQKFYGSYFYEFDTMNQTVELDIRKPLTGSKQALINRFSITFLEDYNWNVYNSEEGFKNILAITAKEGFILINKCPRMVENRQQLDTLNYIELSCDSRSDGGFSYVLIPKDQTLSIKQVNENIQKNIPLKKYLATITEVTYLPTECSFSTIKVDSMPLIGASRNEKLTRSEQYNLRRHKEYPSVKDLYQSIQALGAFSSPRISHLFIKLSGKADGFFRYPSETITIDLEQFKEKFALLLTKSRASLTSDGPRLFDAAQNEALIKTMDAIAKQLDELQIECGDTPEEESAIAIASRFALGQGGGLL